MTSRPNLHTRQNRTVKERETASIVTVARPPALERTLNERAFRWLDRLDAEAEGKVLLEALAKCSVARTTAEREDLLTVWWGSDHAELQLVAAIAYLRRSRTTAGKATEDLRNRLAELFQNGETPRIQRIAAFALGALYRDGVRRRTQSTEIIEVLYEALADSSRREIALAVLTTLVTLDDGPRWWGERFPAKNNLLRVLRDPEAPSGTLVAALRVASATNDIYYPDWRERVRSLLGAPDLSDADFDHVVVFMASSDTSGIARFVLDVHSDPARRLRAVECLRKERPHALIHHADWRAIYWNAGTYPEIAASVIELLFEHREFDYGRIIALARTPEIPFVVKRSLYRVLWNGARQIAEFTREGACIPDILFAMNDAATVAHEAFNGALPAPYDGPMSREQVERTIVLMRRLTSSCDAHYRGVLAVMLPVRDDLSYRDRRMAANALLAFIDPADETGKERIYRRLIGHAKESERVARDLVRDERLPIATRLEILDTGVPYHEIFRFARDHALSDSARWELSRILRRFHIKDVSLVARLSTANARTEPWLADLVSSEFCDENATALVEVVVNEERPAFAREVALELLRTDVTRTPDRGPEVLQKLFACARSPGLATASFRRPFGVLAYTCMQHPQSATRILPILIAGLNDPLLPEEIRELFLTNVPDHLLKQGADGIWQAARSAENRRLRSAIVRRFREVHLLPANPFLNALLVELESPMTAETQADVDRHWSELAPVARLWSADVAELLTCIADPQTSSLIRQCAVGLLDERPIEDSDRRRFWSRLGAKDIETLWSDPRVRHAICRHGRPGLPNPRLQDILLAGPAHPWWLPMVRLAGLPDQALAAEAMSEVNVSMEIPDSVPLVECHARLAPHVPDAGMFAVAQLRKYSEAPGELIQQLDRAFQHAHAHHSSVDDLLHALITAMSRPRQIVIRIGQVLDTCSFPDDPSDNDPRAVTDVLRYADLEARLTARTFGREVGNFGAEPDLIPDLHGDQLLGIEPGLTVARVAEKLRDRVTERCLDHLPNLTKDQLGRVFQSTTAPAVLLGQYLRMHPDGLPLLAEALGAASEGTTSWEDWRFDRPRARAQIAHLDEAGVALWRKNLRMSIGIERVPDDVRQAAQTIRDRFQHARHQGEIAPEYQELLVSSSDAPERIRCYRALIKDVIGPAIGGDPAVPDAHTPAHLPEEFEREVRKAEQRKDRQQLIALRYRLERAIDLLRLLYCDESALARNELRARGETRDTQTEGAVAHFKKLRVAFQSAPTRQLRQVSDSEDPRLASALQVAQDALDGVKTFAPSKSLVVSECSDFKTLIEIGNRPYGQGSCQNYATSSSYNRGLLAYVVDAMTKALVLHTAPSPESPTGTPLARSILRLGATRDGGQPVIVIEKTYAAGGEADKYRDVLLEGVKEFARQRGWRAAFPQYSPTINDDEDVVALPASQNGVQYEDGAGSIVDGDVDSMPTGGYALRVSYLC